MYSILATGGATTNMFSNIDFTAITDAAATIAPQVITPIVTVLSAIIGIKLLKRFGNQIG